MRQTRIGILSSSGGAALTPPEIFLAATGLTGDPTIDPAINQLYTDLVAAGIWNKMYAIYPFVGGTANTHKYNLKDARDLDAAFRLTYISFPTHDANGITGDGVSAYAQSHLSLADVLTDIYSASMHIYSRSNFAEANSVAGLTSFGSPSVHRFFLYANLGGTLIGDCWGTGAGNGFRASGAVADSLGLIGMSRTTQTDHRVFKNGVQVGATQTLATTGSPASDANGVILLAQWGTAFYSSRNIAFWSIGEGLSVAENADLYTAVQAFQTALGRQV